MQPKKMSALNDDGFALDLTVVFVLFMMPNILLVVLGSLAASLLYISNRYRRLKHCLGKLANFFAKGALDRIIRNILRRLDVNNQQRQGLQISLSPLSSLTRRTYSHFSRQSSNSCSSKSNCEHKHDASYLLLIPFQLDLLFTVLVYKILTRDVYYETCQSYLTTYHNRQTQVVCWLKHVNHNSSNLSFNITLHRYCDNQTITYINYEHNDVICAQYVFRSINIIDTITNIFAWHQAIVFVVTQSIVFSHWYQGQIRKSRLWKCFPVSHRRSILFLIIGPLLFVYLVFFVFLTPIHFFLREKRRVDLTHHLLYACSKFLIGNVLHTNLYALKQWYSICKEKDLMLSDVDEKGIEDNISSPNMRLSNSSNGGGGPSNYVVSEKPSLNSKHSQMSTHV